MGIKTILAGLLLMAAPALLILHVPPLFMGVCLSLPTFLFWEDVKDDLK